jgi:hypothetical protein
MKLEAVKDFLATSAGCFVAVFASVWVMHGPEQSLQINAIAVMILVALFAAVLNEFIPSTTSRPVPTEAEIQKALTPRRVAFYILGFFAFGLVVAGIGVL